jgi:1,4-alpha-glucan branching enzyme
VEGQNCPGGVPGPSHYREILNSDSTFYGGSNLGNAGGGAESCPWSDRPKFHKN